MVSVIVVRNRRVRLKKGRNANDFITIHLGVVLEAVRVSDAFNVARSSFQMQFQNRTFVHV